MFLTTNENFEFWKNIHDRIEKIHSDVDDSLYQDFSHGFLYSTYAQREMLGIDSFEDFYHAKAYNLDYPFVAELEYKLDELLNWVQEHLDNARSRDEAFEDARRERKVLMSPDEEEEGEYWAYPYDQAASLQNLKKEARAS